MKRPHLVMAQFVAAAFILAVLFEDRMPDIMVTHWDSSGEADGVGSKLVGLWLMPLLMLGLYGLMLIVPAIDPKSKNIDKFRRQWHNFMILMFGFVLYIYVLTLYWNLGNEFNIVRPIVPAVALLLVGVSYLLKASKQNFSIGIRTPWTLSSKNVWQRTHELGAKMFLVAAGLVLLGVIWPSLAVWFIVGLVILSALGLVIYSYIAFRQETHNK